MTEKRFEFTGCYMVDNETGDTIECNKDGFQDIVELCNEFDEENKQLRKDRHRYIEESNNIFDKYKELEEENKELADQRFELFIRERDCHNDWRELKRENEKLNGEKDFLIKMVDYFHNRLYEKDIGVMSVDTVEELLEDNDADKFHYVDIEYIIKNSIEEKLEKWKRECQND